MPTVQLILLANFTHRQALYGYRTGNSFFVYFFKQTKYFLIEIFLSTNLHMFMYAYVYVTKAEMSKYYKFTD